MFKRKLQVFLLICCCLSGSTSQEENISRIGRACRTNYHSIGQCELFSKCHNPTNTFLEQYGDNSVCGYQNDERIICCKDDDFDESEIMPIVVDVQSIYRNRSLLDGASCTTKLGTYQCTLSVHCQNHKSFCGFNGIHPYVCCEDEDKLVQEYTTHTSFPPNQQIVGKSCQMKYKENGKCEKFSNCKHETNAFLESYNDNVLCGYEGGEKVICCREEEYENLRLRPIVIDRQKVATSIQLDGAECTLLHGNYKCTLSVYCKKFNHICGYDGKYPYVCCEDDDKRASQFEGHTIVGKKCQMSYKQNGKCELDSKCNHETNTFLQHYDDNVLCGYQLGEKVICCRDESSEQRGLSDIVVHKDRISRLTQIIDPECRLSDGLYTCTQSVHCKKFNHFCGFDNNIPYVCCEDKKLDNVGYTTSSSHTKKVPVRSSTEANNNNIESHTIEGRTCQMPYKQNGICKLDYRCNHETNSFLRRYQPDVLCGYENGDRVICCRDESSEQRGLSDIVVNKDRISRLSRISDPQCRLSDGLYTCTQSVHCKNFNHFCGFDSNIPYVCCEDTKLDNVGYTTSSSHAKKVPVRSSTEANNNNIESHTIEGRTCQMPYKQNGICKLDYRCNHETNSFLRRYQPDVLCGYENGDKVICCRDESSEQRGLSDIVVNKDRISRLSRISDPQCRLSDGLYTCTQSVHCKKFNHFCGFDSNIPYVCCEDTKLDDVGYTTSSSHAKKVRSSTEANNNNIESHTIEGRTCQMPYKQNGICKLDYRCNHETNSFLRRYQPDVLCGYENGDRVICCRDESSEQRGLSDIVVNKDRISRLSRISDPQCRLSDGLYTCTESVHCKKFNHFCGFDSNIPYVCCEDTKLDNVGYTTSSSNTRSNRPALISSTPRYNHNYDNSDKSRGPLNRSHNSHGHGNKYSPVSQQFSNSDVGRKAREKCSDYSRLVNQNFNCGSRVQGQERASLNEYPHMALLGYQIGDRKQWACSGVLISERYVLAAAHCLNMRQFGRIKYVRLGELDISTDSDGAQPQEMEAEYLITHPDYDSRYGTKDIGLIRLRETVIINSHIVPACLTTETINTNTEVYGTGWRWEDDNECDSPLRKVLMSTQIKDGCRGMSRSSENDVICMEVRNDPYLPSRCSDDSVGPIQLNNKNEYCMYNVIGLATEGNICDQNKKVLFTDVSQYVEWIENIVWS